MEKEATPLVNKFKLVEAPASESMSVSPFSFFLSWFYSSAYVSCSALSAISLDYGYFEP